MEGELPEVEANARAAEAPAAVHLASRGGKLLNFLRFAATLCAIIAYLAVASRSDEWRTTMFPLIVAAMALPVYLFSRSPRDLVALLVALLGGAITFMLPPTMGATIGALAAASIAILVLFPWWLELFSGFG